MLFSYEAISLDAITGYEIKEVLGIVLGNTVRAKHIGMKKQAKQL